MIAAEFVYEAPTTVDEALRLRARAGAVDVISGGTWVVPEMTRGVRRPDTVVDLRRLGLSFVRKDEAGIVVGATTCYSDLAASDLVRERVPVIAEMAAGITGGPQLRNRATIGGAACHARPSSDVPATLVGLDARLRLRSERGTRELDAAAFFLGAFRTACRPDELLTEIVIPDDPDLDRAAYVKFKLCASSWPIASAFCSLHQDGTVHRLALGAVCAVPLLVDSAAGKPAGSSLEIAASAQQAIDEPWSDALASGDYRRAIAGVIAARAVAAALEAQSVGGHP